MVYRINDAGDACCIQIGSVFETDLLLDFGFSHSEKFDAFVNTNNAYKVSIGKKLLISHYHDDHFNGLMRLKTTRIRLDLSELYVPFISQFDDKTSHELLLKQILFSMFLKSGHLVKGSPALYIQELVNQINNKPIDLRALKQGDKIEIGHTTYHVVWPPENIKQEDQVTALKKGIKGLVS
jgi:ribonuclease BN (tRNA processing enzyme)